MLEYLDFLINITAVDGGYVVEAKNYNGDFVDFENGIFNGEFGSYFVEFQDVQECTIKFIGILDNLSLL